ncbi:MAG: DUF2490 domain-containing protein [Segetibacter sp.]
MNHSSNIATLTRGQLPTNDMIPLQFIRRWPYKSLIILLFFFSSICRGQAFELGSWNIVNIKYNYNQKWSFFGEAQLRSLKFYNNFHYHEFKSGVDYKMTPVLRLTLAAGKYDTYQEGGNFVEPKNNNEFRIWPQVTLLQSLWKLKIEQRYRAEFRFTSDGYRNRFRYRLGISYPIGKQKNDYKPFMVSASNELFFTDKEPFFERNRLLLSLNYKVSKLTSLQIGYLHQFDYKINDETGRDFLVLGLIFEFYGKHHQQETNNIEVKDN